MALVKYNNNSISAITTAGTLSASQVLIKEQTASASSDIQFIDGTAGVVLDSTYPIYRFDFINCNPATNDVEFEFNMSTDGGSNYNVTKTTTLFSAFHYENDSSTFFGYDTSRDLAQSTANQKFTASGGIGNDSDHNVSGSITIFNPSSTTFVKHFIARCNYTNHADVSIDCYLGGYGNTTSSIDAFKFLMSSGNFDGTIKLYGIKDS